MIISNEAVKSFPPILLQGIIKQINENQYRDIGVKYFCFNGPLVSDTRTHSTVTGMSALSAIFFYVKTFKQMTGRELKRICARKHWITAKNFRSNFKILKNRSCSSDCIFKGRLQWRALKQDKDKISLQFKIIFILYKCKTELISQTRLSSSPFPNAQFSAPIRYLQAYKRRRCPRTEYRRTPVYTTTCEP